jgi:hypothetical protein
VSGGGQRGGRLERPDAADMQDLMLPICRWDMQVGYAGGICRWDSRGLRGIHGLGRQQGQVVRCLVQSEWVVKAVLCCS